MRSKENSLIEAMFTWASATALLPPKRLSARWPEPQRRPTGVQAWRAGLGWALRTSLDWARFSTQKRAQAYEHAFTAIQNAESNYYFHRVGLAFKDSKKSVIDYSGVDPACAKPDARNIPPSDCLTPDGQTLYYRVIKTLQVLEDVLANKIPDLQDLKDAKGDTSQTTTATAPVKP